MYFRNGKITIPPGLLEHPQPNVRSQYNASKAGVLQLAKSLAVEWVDFCRVNSVSPGYVQTQIMEYASKEMPDKWLGQIPARRFASPYELKGVWDYINISRD